MQQLESHSRRSFLIHSASALSAVGAGVLVGNQLFADRTQLAAKLEDAPKSHELTPALQLGTAALKALDKVKDYTADFTKRELVGRKIVDAKMNLKLRHDPFSVYVKFIKPSAGREVLYVEGENDNRLKAHDVGLAGLAGTLTLDVDGSFAMSDNRYPVTMIGMQNLAATLLEQWLEQVKIPGVALSYFPNARIGTTSCKAIETSYATQKEGVKYALTRLYVETDTTFPIRVQQYEFAKRKKDQPVLVEDYLYTNIKTNVGLKDADFSVDNPSYAF